MSRKSSLSLESSRSPSLSGTRPPLPQSPRNPFADSRFHLRRADYFLREGHLERALLHSQTAIDIDERCAEAWLIKGHAQRRLGQSRLALDTLLQAAEMMPQRADVYHLIGVTCMSLERYEAAAEAFRRIIALHPEDGTARHLLDAVTGKTTTGAPADYVVRLFDRYAKTFDDHMTGDLNYRLPGLLKRAIRSRVRKKGPFRHVLDLGCGTGLVGKALHRQSRRLTGVDLSAGMMAVAERKKIYDHLFRDEATRYLRATNDRFDLVVAADVFIYFGELETVFRLVHRCLESKGMFMFSLEAAKSAPDFHLQTSGRYAHSRDYVRGLAASCGFGVISDKAIVLRMEMPQWLYGRLFVLQRG